MKLITKEIVETIPALYSQESRGDAARAVVKFFDPTGSWTWYASEGSFVCPEHGNYDCAECPKPWRLDDFLFFGLVFGAEVEYGYFSLSELQGWPGRMGLGIERDLYWKPQTFAEIKQKVGVR
jgi:hypothetical protein